MSFLTLLGIYLFGGLTFLPLLAILIYVTHATEKLLVDPPQKPTTKDVYGQRGNEGWIRLTTRYKPKDAESSGLLAGIQAAYMGPLSRRSKGLVYGVLKHGALFLYEGSDQQEPRLILPMHDYKVSLYPENKSESELFGRHTAIRLKINPTSSPSTQPVSKDSNEVDISYLLNTDLYLVCARSVDKEDWLLALTSACEMMAESPDKAHIETIDQTHFDPPAMQALIGTVHQDANHYEIQWLNAIMGRLFLGIYRTESLRKYCQDTLATKSKKAHLPHFLGDLHVKSVDVGKSIPYITRPRLLSLSPEGDLLAEAHVEYNGGLCVVVETDISVSYSSLMKPLKVRLVLSVQLKRFVGKFNIKIKPPPSNRFWIGFCETPDMTWAITPEVSDKQIKLAMVTNAIESKIRDFIVETMVLPNMEDFPFCSSGGRGGVFGERIPKSTMSPSQLSKGSDARPESGERHSSAPDILVNTPKAVRKPVPKMPLEINTPTESFSSSTSSSSSSSVSSTSSGSSGSSTTVNASDPSLVYSEPDSVTLLEDPNGPELYWSPETAHPTELLFDQPFTQESPPPIQALVFDDPVSTIVDQSTPRWTSSFRRKHSKKTEELDELPADPCPIDEDTQSIASTKRSLLTKIGGSFKSEAAKKTLANKKNTLYSVADTLFHKHKDTHEVRKKRNQEMQEIHARKMSAFSNRVADMQRRCSELPVSKGALESREIGDSALNKCLSQQIDSVDWLEGEGHKQTAI